MGKLLWRGRLGDFPCSDDGECGLVEQYRTTYQHAFCYGPPSCKSNCPFCGLDGNNTVMIVLETEDDKYETSCTKGGYTTTRN